MCRPTIGSVHQKPCLGEMSVHAAPCRGLSHEFGLSFPRIWKRRIAREGLYSVVLETYDRILFRGNNCVMSDEMEVFIHSSHNESVLAKIVRSNLNMFAHSIVPVRLDRRSRLGFHSQNLRTVWILWCSFYSTGWAYKLPARIFDVCVVCGLIFTTKNTNFHMCFLTLTIM